MSGLGREPSPLVIRMSKRNPVASQGVDCSSFLVHPHPFGKRHHAPRLPRRAPPLTPPFPRLPDLISCFRTSRFISFGSRTKIAARVARLLTAVGVPRSAARLISIPVPSILFAAVHFGLVTPVVSACSARRATPASVLSTSSSCVLSSSVALGFDHDSPIPVLGGRSRTSPRGRPRSSCAGDAGAPRNSWISARTRRSTRATCDDDVKRGGATGRQRVAGERRGRAARVYTVEVVACGTAVTMVHALVLMSGNYRRGVVRSLWWK